MIDCPLGSLKRVVLFGAVGISAGARTLFSMRGIETILVSKNGNFLGTTALNSSGDKPKRLKAQVLSSMDDDFSLRISKNMVEAKIRHCLSVVCNYTKSANVVSECQRKLKDVIGSLATVVTKDQVRGIEGEAAAFYFSALGEIVPEEMRFEIRSRRPPKDVFNAIIGYGYAILLGECISALYSAGLSPYFGFLHADEDGRPGLALDFMEEFRPYVVDTMALSLVRRRSITLDNAIASPDNAGVYIDKDAKKSLTLAYEQRMLTTTKEAIPGFAGSIRRVMYRQAQLLLAAILSGDPERYRGIIWR